MKVAEATAAAAAAAAAAHNGERYRSSRGAASPGAAPPTAGANEAAIAPGAQHSDPPAAGTRRPEGTEEEAPVATGGVLDSKRPATSTVKSDPKRRRRSLDSNSSRARASSQRDGDGDDGGVVDSLSRAVGSGAGNAAGGGGLSRTAARRRSTKAALEMAPHPVFARREQAAKVVEASAPSAADVVGMAREAKDLADKVRACEEKLSAANTAVRTPTIH